MIEPKRGAPPMAPARVRRNPGPIVNKDHDAGMRQAIVDRATSPVQAKAAVDFGYGALIDAARADAPSSGRDRTGMPAPVRAKMEGALGADFSEVRVRPESPRAVEMGALAFTQGSEVHVAPGHWAPETTKGQELLGHELTHVLQQRAGRVTATAQAMGVGLNDEPALEREADTRGARAAIDAGYGDLIEAARGKAGRQRGEGRNPSNAVVQRAILPGYAQKGDTCEPASLVTALLIWDRENANPTAPSANMVELCNASLIYMSRHKPQLVADWSTGGTDGAKRYDSAYATITAIRADARMAGAVISEAQFQQIAQILSNFGGDINDIEAKLGLVSKTQAYDTLDGIWKSPELTGLGNDRIAQIEWHVNTTVVSTTGEKSKGSGYHAFLIGRQKTGKWFISDQGNKPPFTAEADTLADLRAKVEAEAQAGRYWLNTDPTKTREMLTWTGVRVLGPTSNFENVHKGLVSPGTFLAQVQGKGQSWWCGDPTPDRIIAWDWVGSGSDLNALGSVFGKAGYKQGFLIGELPQGCFNVWKTSPVDKANFVKSIDTSAGGLLTQTPALFLHAWLWLIDAGKNGAEMVGFVSVY